MTSETGNPNAEDQDAQPPGNGITTPLGSTGDDEREDGAGTNPSGNDADDQHAPEVATDPEHRD